MAKNFRTLSKKRTIKDTMVGATILDIKRNKDSGRFVLVLDNGNIVHVGGKNEDKEVVISRKKY